VTKAATSATSTHTAVHVLTHTSVCCIAIAPTDRLFLVTTKQTARELARLYPVPIRARICVELLEKIVPYCAVRHMS